LNDYVTVSLAKSCLGEPGTPEHLEELKKRIDARIEQMRATGQWDDDASDSFGKPFKSNVFKTSIEILFVDYNCEYDAMNS
jgi:hypothetical protein